jgi:hypothetical protein
VNASQLAALAHELQTDPLSFGYPALLAAGALGAICDAMNAPTQSMLGELSAARAITWGAAGPMSTIVDASTNATHPARASCLSFLQSLKSGMPVDMTNANVSQLFAGWVAAGVITQAQSDAAVALAQRPASRADVLGLPAVTVEDIHASGVI